MTAADKRAFVDDRHALYVGWVLGIALRNGLEAEPIADDQGNFTDRIQIKLPKYRTTGGTRATGTARWSIAVVIPPPPDDLGA